MPLDVIQINRGKQESIFEKLNPFVDKLVGAYKQKKQNEYDNEWISAALADIDQANSKQQTDSFLLKKDPPEDYIDVEGMTKFANDSINILNWKEQVSPTTTPSIEGQTQQKELLPDVKEFNELYKFVSELPTGKVDWTNTREVFKKRLDSGRAMGAQAQNFLNMIIGQSMPTDQRAKFEQDYDLASKMKKELYPETEEEGVVFDPNQFLKDNPNMEISGYNSNTGGFTFGKKEAEESKPGIDLEKLNKFLSDNNMKLKGVNANPSTGNISYTFGTDEPKTTADPKPTWEGNLRKAEEFINGNPGFEITGTNPDSGSVTISKKGENTPESGKSRPNMDKYLFGDTGIINDDIKGNIEGGYPLSEEEIELVVKNHNLRKHTLTEEELTEVELIFDQIGIDPNETKTPEVVLPGGPQSKPKGAITKFGENIKSNTLGLLDLIKGGKDKEGEVKVDSYGYTLDEIREVNGKKYQYKGNDEWLPL